MVGGKWEEWAYLISFCLKKNLTTTLEHDTYSFAWVGKSLVSQLTKIINIFSRVMGVDFESFITKPSVVSLCVREVCKQNIQPQNTYHSLCHHWVSPCSGLQLEIVSTLKSACINGRFLAFDVSFHHWLAIEGFHEMFDIDSFIHISWIVLGTLRTIDITGGLSHTC